MNYKIDIKTFDKINEIYIFLCENSDPDTFFENYYSELVQNAEDYFKFLDPPACTLLASRFGEVLLNFYKMENEVDFQNKSLKETIK